MSPQAPAERVLPPPSAKLLISLAAILAGLYAADRFLAQIEVKELHAEAATLYRQALDLERRGSLPEAIERLRRAHSLERDDREYALALTGAEIEARQYGAAQIILNDLLENDPNDGRANLLAARLKIAESKFDEADSYYHRAIYASWPNPSDTLNARLELIELLLRRDAKKELLAETLVLESDAASNPAVARKIPELYIQAGAPRRARDAYQRLIAESPDNPDLYVALGRTQLLAGDFREARTAFLEAMRRKPNDRGIAALYRVATEAIELDPTPRRQTSQAKYVWSMRILELAANELTACAAGKELSAEAHADLDDATSALAAKAPRDFSNELAESRLSLAERLWHARIQICGKPPEREPLSLIMSKLSQSLSQ
jgi:tetratricopeptide (TPR) repeat protein